MYCQYFFLNLFQDRLYTMYALEIIPITSSILKETLTYFSKSPLEPGVMVSIPLRNRTTRGIVVSSAPVQDIKQNLRHQNFTIRNITHIHDEVLFSAAYLQTIAQLKNYYCVQTGKVIDITYPRAITKNPHLFARIPTGTPLPISTFTETLVEKNYQERIEYYAHTIHDHLSLDQSVHILCPTVYHVKKVTKSLADKGIFVMNAHGKTTIQKLQNIYSSIQHTPTIFVSTPSFIDIPLFHKMGIILEQDSSESYYQVMAPHIDMRLLIEQYARHSNIPIYYGDTLLRPARYSYSHTLPDTPLFPEHRLQIISAKEKNNAKQTDTERVRDITQKKDYAPLSPKIITIIEKAIQNKEKIFCYVPRKSLAPHIVCRSCGLLAQDQHTHTPYSLYIKKNQHGDTERIYINTFTNTHIPAFDICQHCNSWHLVPIGIGTDGVIEQLHTAFPGITVLACDSYHTKTESALQKVFKEFNTTAQEQQPIILVGTVQALPFLSAIDTSIIVSLDGMLTHMSYTTETRVMYLIKNILDTTQKLYIQTRTELSTAIPSLKHNNHALFITDTQTHAKKQGSTPYGTQICIRHRFLKKDYQKIHTLYRERLSEWLPHITVRPDYKKEYQVLNILLHLALSDWNINTQNPYITQYLPVEERDVHVHINPEIF